MNDLFKKKKIFYIKCHPQNYKHKRDKDFSFAFWGKLDILVFIATNRKITTIAQEIYEWHEKFYTKVKTIEHTSMRYQLQKYLLKKSVAVKLWIKWPFQKKKIFYIKCHPQNYKHKRDQDFSFVFWGKLDILVFIATNRKITFYSIFSCMVIKSDFHKKPKRLKKVW